MNSRRTFLKQFSLLSGSLAVFPSLHALGMDKKPWFEISLAQWSLHKMLHKGELTTLEFPAFTAKEFGIYGVEYVNSFFKSKVQDKVYLSDLKKRSSDSGVRNVLIMIDGEGNLGDSNESKRQKAIDNHCKWIDAAHYLGCHAIRLNADGDGDKEAIKSRAADSLVALSDYARKAKMSVLIENHGGISSYGDWLADLIKKVNKKNCGSLPDFGNFYEYDRYQGVRDLIPFAKGVSAKAHDFDNEGYETGIDYNVMMKIVKDSGYRGYIGIEYEGDKWSEVEGIKRTKALLEKYR